MRDYFEWTEELFSPGKEFEKPEALEGIRVLDLTMVIHGPETASLLAEFGAEVIKIEPVRMGDLIRSVSLWARFWKENSLGAMWVNRNKYHVAIDLKTPKGRDLFLKLVEKSDVIVENFRPGVMERLGLSYRHLRDVKPDIIYISLSGYGQWGERWDWPSFDAIGQAMSGASAVSGYEGRVPLRLPHYPGDFINATVGFMCVLVALYYRDRTEKGQYIDISQVETLPRIMDAVYSYVALKNQNRPRMGNRDPNLSPANVYRTADGKLVTISILSQKEFESLCKAMNSEYLLNDDRFSTTSARLKKENADELDRMVSKWVAGRILDDVMEAAKTYGFSASPVRRSFEVYHDEHLRDRRSVWIYDDPLFGDMVSAGNPLKMSRTPARIKWSVYPVGYHNRYVLKRVLGLSDDEIDGLLKEGVISYWADFIGRKPPADFDPEKDPVFIW